MSQCPYTGTTIINKIPYNIQVDREEEVLGGNQVGEVHDLAATQESLAEMRRQESNQAVLNQLADLQNRMEKINRERQDLQSDNQRLRTAFSVFVCVLAVAVPVFYFQFTNLF